MELTKEEKKCMIDVLRTLIYNSVDELKTKLTNAKSVLNDETYKLMIFGNDDIFSDNGLVKDRENYKSISFLENRWCLQSQLFYHLKKTKKIKEEEYNELLKI